MGDRFYYALDYNEYVTYHVGVFYSVKPNGTLKQDIFYDRILIGSIWVDDITKEEFCSHLTDTLEASIEYANKYARDEGYAEIK